MPRVETTRTLAQTLGPQPECAAGLASFDLAIDALAAQQLLRRIPWGRAWMEADPAGFTRAAGHLARTAQAIARAAFDLHPSARADHWARVRDTLAPIDGPGGHERKLARIAAEWAMLTPPPSTDRLFALRPAAWCAISAAGLDGLTTNLLAAAPAETPCAVIDTDRAGPEDPESRLPANDLTFVLCADFEEEAQCAAAQVLRHLSCAQQPVALIAQDRVLIRRVRALLERASVAIVDETGWKLATTRAAARVMALLRAAQPAASSDQLLDWLKTGVGWPVLIDPHAAIRSLEACCRKLGMARIEILVSTALDAPAQRLLTCAAATLDLLGMRRPKALRQWVGALGSALADCGALDAMSRDDAGLQVLSVLRLGPMRATWTAELGLAGEEPLSAAAFIDWVDAELEQESFLPRSVGLEQAQVVITPLAQAMLRPFAAVVLPGADGTRLGASGAPHPLLSEALAVSLGLPSAAQRHLGEKRALAHLLDCRLTLLRRRQDGSQPLGDSPLVEQIAIGLRREGRAYAPWSDPRSNPSIEPRPIERTAPSAMALLPQRLSASAVEALRDCPYRFFAKVVLRLREPDELERDLEKRDYGIWLHAVLYLFHRGREQPEQAAAEIARLIAMAQACQADLRLDDAEFLPFMMSFRALVPRYVEWLHARDRLGFRWLHGEYEVVVSPQEFEGVALEGHIDRIDVLGEGDGEGTDLIDYKTGNLDALKRRVKEPLEDTQLAFYAAILPAELRSGLRAAYLAVDSSKGIEFIEHKDVTRSARTLVTGLASELRRLREGAGLPALGEGETCERCEVRGLCRRDHWAHAAAGQP